MTTTIKGTIVIDFTAVLSDHTPGAGSVTAAAQRTQAVADEAAEKAKTAIVQDRFATHPTTAARVQRMEVEIK